MSTVGSGEDVHDGSCFCGLVRYRVHGKPKFVVHDHCSVCRRVAGAAYVTWCGVKEEQFELIGGGEELTTFASTLEATRQFCRRCGSHLFFRSARWPGEVHVTLATLHTRPAGGAALAPTAHVFWTDRAHWLEQATELPRRGGPTGVEPLDES